MSNSNSFLVRNVLGNPIYVLSAAVMMYGIAIVLNRPGHAAGDIPHILSAYAALQIYEAALIGLAIWILLRLWVPEDGHTLLILEVLFLSGAFIALDELLAANTPVGLGVAAGGLALAAVKLGLARRPLGLSIGRLPRGLALGFIALPIASAAWMKPVVDVPVMAAWTAYAAWLALAAAVLGVFLLTGQGAFGRPGGQSRAALWILGLATLLGAGCHLYSLHHVFLAPSEVWYPAPALIVLAAFAVRLVFSVSPRDRGREFVALWLPMAPMVLFYLDSSAGRWPWRELPPTLQPLQLTQGWLLLVYGGLVLVTRRKLLAIPASIALVVAAGQRRELVVGYVADHRGWSLVLLAFALLALGGWLTTYKHRRRATCVESPMVELA